jgi:hypothetical protein
MPERDEGYMMQHLCECFVDNNSEKLNVLWFGPPNQLIPWPEIPILMEIHGEQAVYDIKPVALGPRETPNREKERLVLKYGRDEVEKVYAGKAFNMEFFMPGWPVDPKAKSAPRQGQNQRPKRVARHEPEEALDSPV